jgi:hypothetical protein
MEKRKKLKINHSLVLILFCVVQFACESKEEWINTLPKPWTISENDFSEILPKFHKKFPNFHERLKAFSVWQIGTPYQIFCLGEEVEPDPDPIFRLDVSDCTVHILTGLASVQSKSWNEAKDNLIQIHYKSDNKGRSAPSYKHRWHFTTDRIQDNYSTQDISSSLLMDDQLEKRTITLNQKQNGDEFLELDWSKKTSASYIPNDMLSTELLKKLPTVAGVAFVKESYFKMGLMIAHEGMIVDQKDIIHASQEFKKTVRMDFMDYYFNEDGPRFDGIMIYSFHPLES